MSSNQFRHLGRFQFINQEKVQQLNLSNNFIASLHHKDTFKGLLSLQSLDLSKNIITSLRNGTFAGVKSLIELHLTSNKISSIEEGSFGGLGRLRVLHLDNNLLESINASWLQHLTSLRFLYLSHNRIKQLADGTFKPLIALRVLSLHDNRVHKIDDMAFDGPIARSLDTVDLSYNLLPGVPTSPLSQLAKMASLDLSGNPIKQLISSSFSQFYMLEKLQLNNMYQLQSLDGHTFLNNARLSQLYLENNQELLPLPYGIFAANALLKTLSLRNNTKWTTLSPHQVPVRSIRQLMISGINFNCNCSLIWLWEMYQRQNDSGITMDAARCTEYTKRSTSNKELSSNNDIDAKDIDLLAKMHPDQLACSDWSAQTLVVIIAVSVLITVCLFLIVAVSLMLRYRRYKSRTGSGYGSPCLHIKDDTMVFRGTLKYDNHGNSNQHIQNTHLDGFQGEMLVPIPSPPSYHNGNHNISTLDIASKKVSPTIQKQTMVMGDNGGHVSMETSNEPLYEVPKYSELLPTSSEGSDPKSSASGSSKYSSCGYVGSELWDPDYFVNINNASGPTTAHCYTNPALSNSRTLTNCGNVYGSPFSSSGTSSGVGTGSGSGGSGSSTVSNQHTTQQQQFRPVFFSPQTRHISNVGYNLVTTLNSSGNIPPADRSYYHHSLYQGGNGNEKFPLTTSPHIMPFSSPQVISKYSNGTFHRSPLRNIDDREDTFLVSPPPPPAPHDSTLNGPSTAFLMFNKPPRTKRKTPKNRNHGKNGSLLLQKGKHISDTEGRSNSKALAPNSNITINGGIIAKSHPKDAGSCANSYV